MTSANSVSPPPLAPGDWIIVRKPWFFVLRRWYRGTLGCFVRRDADLYLLTAGHVISGLEGRPVFDWETRTEIGRVGEVDDALDIGLVRLHDHVQWTNVIPGLRIGGVPVQLRSYGQLPLGGVLMRTPRQGTIRLDQLQEPREESIRGHTVRSALYWSGAPLGGAGSTVMELGSSGSALFQPDGTVVGVLRGVWRREPAVAAVDAQQALERFNVVLA